LVYRQTPESDARRERREAQILRAARRLLGRHGFQGTTMQQIATAARTSIGNLYFYFASKDALLRALLERAMTAEWRAADAIAARLPAGPPRLAVMVMRNADWLLERDRDVTRILLESATTRRVADWVAEQNGSRLLRYLQAHLPERLGTDPVGAAAMWGGAARGCIEAALQGDPAVTASEHGAVVLRWNLRALGLDDAAIDDAISAARAAIAVG
jgi:AcrR family transcriptional regulator